MRVNLFSYVLSGGLLTTVLMLFAVIKIMYSKFLQMIFGKVLFLSPLPKLLKSRLCKFGHLGTGP